MPLPTLLLIDIQRGFALPTHLGIGWGERSNPGFEAATARLLAGWRRAGAPVIHVRHDSRYPDSPLRPGQDGNAFMDCAAPLAGEVIVSKQVNSAFIGTRLQALLDEAGATAVVVAGLVADHCVSTTARMAANLGYHTTVVSDATATHARHGADGVRYAPDLVHRVSLASLDPEFASVRTTAEILSLLESTSCAPASASLPSSVPCFALRSSVP